MRSCTQNRTIARLDGVDLNAVSISTEGSRTFQIECDSIPPGARKASPKNRYLEINLASGRNLQYSVRLVKRQRNQISVAVDNIVGDAE